MYYSENSVIYYDGKFLSAPGPGTDLYSQTLHYGNGIFEGIRVYPMADGSPKIFKPKEHFERFIYSASTMRLKCDWSVEELTEISYQVLKRNNFNNAYLRPLLIVGADMSLLSSQKSILVVQAWEWGKYMGDRLLKVGISPYQRPNPKACHVDAKVTGHYTNSILATTVAKEAGYDQPLLLDLNGNVAEGAGANIFFEKDGTLVTPPLGYIMPGITRATIMELCQEHRIPCEERFFKPEELLKAESAFYVGTAAEVTGIESIDGHHFPKPWAQSIGAKLSSLYQDLVYCRQPKTA